jgi:hypothetical protein
MIKPDVWWSEMHSVVRWVILHVVLNIRLGFCLENTQEAYNPESLVSSVKCGGGSVVIWAAISWYFAGPAITLNGQITASDYMHILGNYVHSVVQ